MLAADYSTFPRRSKLSTPLEQQRDFHPDRVLVNAEPCGAPAALPPSDEELQEERAIREEHEALDSAASSNDSANDAQSSSIAPLSVVQKQVLKCAIAYTLASLFTFVPVLSRVVGRIGSVDDEWYPSPMAHMSATVVIYFNPARSLGAMLEADVYCLLGLVYSFAICVAAIGIRYALDRPTPASKGRDKDQQWHTITDVAVVAFVGVSIGAVCWAKARVSRPSFNVAGTMTSIIVFAVIVLEGGFQMLAQVLFVSAAGALITNAVCFALFPVTATSELEARLRSTLKLFARLVLRPSDAGDQVRKSLSLLQHTLDEAKREWAWEGVLGRKRGTAYGQAIKTLAYMERSLAGLRASTEVRASVERPQEGSSENRRKRSVDAGSCRPPYSSVEELDYLLEKLAVACSNGLSHLATHASPDDLPEIQPSIDARVAIISAAYRRQNHQESQAYEGDDTGLTGPAKADCERRASRLLETFALEEFAAEVVKSESAIRCIQAIKQERESWGLASRIFHSMCGCLSCCGRKPRRTTSSEEEGSSCEIRQDKAPTSQPISTNRHLRVNMKQFWRRLSELLRRADVKFAIKTSVATAMLAAPAFIDSSRSVFMEYRGEWALVSFVVTVSPTVGATNQMFFHRLLGTFIGAALAIGMFMLAPHDAPLLTLFGFLLAVPTFYVIVAHPRYMLSARFVMLTYNIACLFCFNMRQEDRKIEKIALHRAVSVSIGVVWAAIISRYWWPVEARAQVSPALSRLCLEIGAHTLRVHAGSRPACKEQQREVPAEQEAHVSTTERTPLRSDRTRLEVEACPIEQGISNDELAIQRQIAMLLGLVDQTLHEPGFQGKFPAELYRRVVRHLQIAQDYLHLAHCLVVREEWRPVAETILRSGQKEHRDLAGHLLVWVSILAYAIRLKTPVSAYLPPAEQSRQKLVEGIEEVLARPGTTYPAWTLMVAYGLVLRSQIRATERLGTFLQSVFGKSPKDFDRLFTPVEIVERV